MPTESKVKEDANELSQCPVHCLLRRLTTALTTTLTTTLATTLTTTLTITLTIALAYPKSTHSHVIAQQGK